MSLLKRIFTLFALFLVMASFSQCSSVPKLQKKAPMSFGDVYFQEWVAGIQGGGSGVNLFIPVINSEIPLDKVYFRGKVAKLEVKPANPNVFIGRFKTEMNQPKDIILSADPKEEYDNKMPQKEKTIPFELEDDECVVSFTIDGNTMYYKITNIRKEPSVNYPSARPEQD